MLVCTFAMLVTSCATLSRKDSAARATLDSTKATGNALININTASAKELEKLPGIGEVMAERIIEHRQQHGRFRRTEHLMMVRGISDKRFRDMAGMITVD